jgi:phage shock protein B
MTAIVIVSILFIGLPWIVLHHVTRWKTQGGLTKEDENLLDELYELGRRLEERVTTIERIMSADNPGWRTMTHDPASIGIEDETAMKGIMR